MKKITVILFAFLFSSLILNAATITSNAITGNWNNVSTWVGGVVPTAEDDVVLAAGATITLDGNASCRSITYPTTGDGNTELTLAGFTLTVTGNITVGTSGTNTTNLLDVGSGSLSCNNLTINGNTSAVRLSKVLIADGTLTINGTFSMVDNNNIAQKIIQVGEGGTIIFNGDVFKSKFTFILDTNSTVKYLKSGDKVIHSTTDGFQSSACYGNLVLGGGGNTTLNWGGLIIAKSLTLDGTVLRLGGNTLSIQNGATINEGISNPFSNTNMIDITTSGTVFGQMSVSSITSAGFEKTYPLGFNGVYSPLVITSLNATVSGTATLAVRVAGSKHPFVNEANCINRLWDVKATNITSITSMSGYFQYDDMDIMGNESYINRSAVFTNTGWTTGGDGAVDGNNNRINLYGNALSGQWTAAASADFSTPTGKYTVADGNWNANTTWNGAVQPGPSESVTILHNIALNNGERKAVDLIIASSGRLHDNNNTSSRLTLSGTFTNFGIFYDQNAGGVNTFPGKITNHAGAEFNSANTTGSNYLVSGGIENNGNFAIGSLNFNANQTLTGTGKINFSSAITIPADIVVTNQTNVNTKGLNGANANSTLINAENALLELDLGSPSIPMATGILEAGQTNNTVSYYRANPQAIKNQTYWHLSVTGGNTKTLSSNADMTIKGDLIVVSGTTLALAATDATPTITIEGKLNNSGTISFWTSATRYADVLLTGSSEIIAGTGGTTLGKLTANNINPKTSSGSHIINFNTAGGGFVNNGGTFNGNSNLAYKQAGNLSQQIGGTGEIITSGSLAVGNNGNSGNQVTQNGNVSVSMLGMNMGSAGFYEVASGCLTINGASTGNTGDNIRFSPTSDLIITGTGAVNLSRINQTGTYNNLRNLTINRTDNISTGKLIVNNQLTLAQGILTNATANIVMADGSTIVRSEGAMTNAPTVGVGQKISVEYIGNTDKTAGNELVSGKLSNIKVLEGHLYLNANTLLADATEVSPGAKLTLNNGKAFTSDSFTLKGDEANSTATFVDGNTNGNLTTTTVNVEQYVSEGRNWYMGSPVTTAPYNALGRGTKVVEWDEVNKEWDDVTSGTLAPGKGYIQVAGSTEGSSGTVNFSAPGVNSGNIAVILSRTESGTSRGFNLVGNPYPSYLDWNDMIADAVNSGISTSFWYRTRNTDGVYIFVTQNGTSGEVVGGTTANTTITSKIPPMQGFWVRVNENLDKTTYNTTLTFKNAMRSHADNAGNKLKAPRAINERMRIRLQLSNGTATDEALVYFDADAVNAFDNYDSPKMLNNSAIMPDLYTKAGNERLVINGLSRVTDDLEVALGFSLNTAANLKLKTTEISNFDGNTKVYLLDKVANTQTELLPETEYTFSTSTPTTNNESRFSLLFRAPGTSTDVDSVEKPEVLVYVNADKRIAIMAPEKCKYYILNLMGQQMTAGITTQSTLLTAPFAKGVYIVKVLESGKELTAKVIIK